MTKKNVAIRNHAPAVGFAHPVATAQVELDIVNEYERRFLKGKGVITSWEEMLAAVARERGLNVRRIYTLCAILTMGHVMTRSIQKVVFGR